MSGCICQSCENEYKVDIIVTDELWEQIKPEDKPKGGGLLCGNCIIDRIELLNEFSAYKLNRL